MGSQFGNIIFIIWRESVEALLVIGILNAWLARQTDPVIVRRGRIALWAGVGAGLCGAALLGAALLGFGEELSDDTQALYQSIMVLVAAALILQMVFWMRRHGRGLRRELETRLQDAAGAANWGGIFILAAIAVAREGSETVVFLYGTLAAARSISSLGTYAAVLGGLVLAGLSYYVLQLGGRILSWRVFFRVTEVMLLFLAASLILTGIDNLISLDILPTLSSRLWDSSALLPDNGLVGGLVAALTGYRARPALIEVIVYSVYWGLILWLLFRPRPIAKAA